MLDYENDLRIDEDALDIEWLEQASLALKYGKHYALCKKKVSLALEKIKICRAELIREANDDPVGCCEKEKPNAADIEAYYRNSSQHKKAKEEWVELQYELDMAEIAKNEMCFTRKATLENLVILHGQQYFAGPKMPRNLHKEREEAEAQREKLNAGISEKLMRRKK